jgi:hypothetical protein
MTRQRLPNRRPCVTFSFRCNSLRYACTFGLAADGTIAEVFLSNHRSGSDTDAVAKDSAVVCSLALQHGVPLSTIRGALLRDSHGRASSPLGAALDQIVAQDQQ